MSACYGISIIHSSCGTTHKQPMSDMAARRLAVGAAGPNSTDAVVYAVHASGSLFSKRSAGSIEACKILALSLVCRITTHTPALHDWLGWPTGVPFCLQVPRVVDGAGSGELRLPVCESRVTL